MAGKMKVLLTIIVVLYLPVLTAEPISAANNLAAESGLAASQDRVYLLYISRLNCPYCALLKKNVLSPMLNNDSYLAQVELRELSWEGGRVVDFDQQVRMSIKIIRRYLVAGTPTLLFLDESGHELSERMTGYHSEDFYWHYFDKAIKTARGKLLRR